MKSDRIMKQCLRTNGWLSSQGIKLGKKVIEMEMEMIILNK